MKLHGTVGLQINVCPFNWLNGNHQDHAHPDIKREQKLRLVASGEVAAPNTHCLFPGYGWSKHPLSVKMTEKEHSFPKQKLAKPVKISK